MMNVSSIQPDVELRDFLKEKVIVVTEEGEEQEVPVYGDWERSINEFPSDFIVVMLNGDIGGVGMNTQYATGYLMVSIYSKMNDDGSIKKNRIKKILSQFDELVERRITKNYFYKYDQNRFITPTTPNSSTGYSITTLNLTWNTTNDFITNN